MIGANAIRPSVATATGMEAHGCGAGPIGLLWSARPCEEQGWELQVPKIWRASCRWVQAPQVGYDFESNGGSSGHLKRFILGVFAGPDGAVPIAHPTLGRTQEITIADPCKPLSLNKGDKHV